MTVASSDQVWPKKNVNEHFMLKNHLNQTFVFNGPLLARPYHTNSSCLLHMVCILNMEFTYFRFRFLFADATGGGAGSLSIWR
jgi:hypothetical protein